MAKIRKNSKAAIIVGWLMLLLGFLTICAAFLGFPSFNWDWVFLGGIFLVLGTLIRDQHRRELIILAVIFAVITAVVLRVNYSLNVY